MTATLADVAQAASVSIMTASRALSGLVHVREATRERVTRAAELLGYSPDLAARALASRPRNAHLQAARDDGHR
jgi:DNA-binding LacI/PurR family transcriptional regulator